MSKRWVAYLVLAGLLALLSLNAVAYRHATAMMEFSPTGARTAPPEQLGIAGKTKVLLTGVTLPRPLNNTSPTDAEMDYETHTFPNLKGDRLESWYIPNNQTDFLVLLFHGYAASKESLLPIARKLHQMEYSSLLVDFYGSGGSSGNGTTIGFFEADDVLAAFTYAQDTWPNSPILLYGISMGGSAVLRSIAIHGLQPQGLIIEATFDRLLTTVGNRFAAMNLPATPFANLLVFWGGWKAGFEGSKHNPSTYAQSVTCPTLILHGGRDRRVTTEQARMVYSNLKGWKRFSEYPKAGHALVIKNDPQQWQQDIKTLFEAIYK